ncbi:TetR/AcrR family transcriptional regulator [Phytoactinopolyspora limicola]|uniref:TetR/AcrR family transcriptional regulator n=1 Tax=Phytoactinopolyspora limicola TaxID=2715536 RepID=UPI001A9C529E|nr:TetR/AcrR family transcriptional regulator [Phytoactinopolyspora limicola]
MSQPVTSRRDRVRQATLAEIHATARRLLVTRGPGAVTINAVAREMGMSGPSLYHYYASHDELVGAVAAGFFRELTETMERARDEQAEAALSDRLLATCRALRSWVTTHPAEFSWVFASTISEPNRTPGSARLEAAQRFEHILLELIVELWQRRPFPVPDLDDLPRSLRDQLAAYSASIDERLPVEAAHVFLSCWIKLYGLLCMEVLHQLDFAFTDLEPVFEQCLREMSAALGLEYAAPAPVT